MPAARAQRPRRGRDDGGAAVVDFVLVMVVLVPLVLGVIQLGLVLHVRNTLTSAASEGARYAATIDRTPADGAERTRQLVASGLSAHYADDVSAQQTVVAGQPAVEVRVSAHVPALGLFGPSIDIEVAGHAVEEVLP